MINFPFLSFFVANYFRSKIFMKQVMQIMASSYSLNTMRVYILSTMCFSDIFRKKIIFVSIKLFLYALSKSDFNLSFLSHNFYIIKYNLYKTSYQSCLCYIQANVQILLIITY